MVSTVRPKASETPTSPMPTCGKPAAITALPHPPKVSQNVPMASAASFFVFMGVLLRWDSLSVPAFGQVKCVKYPPGGLTNRVGPWANTQSRVETAIGLTLGSYTWWKLHLGFPALGGEPDRGVHGAEAFVAAPL